MAPKEDPFFSALYQANYDKLCRVAYRLTGSMETAHDLTQDAFLLALFRQAELRDHPNPAGWLMVTLTNLVRNEQRKAARQEVSLEDLFGLPAPRAEHDIEELLPARLPEPDRQVLLWRFRDQMDYQALSDRLGVSQSGCRARVSRAVARCRALLEKNNAL